MTKRPERGAPPAAPAEIPAAPALRRGALALWAAIAVLAAARALLAFVPGMAMWALNLQRFLAPAVGWTLWAALALALIPPLARRLARSLEAAGDGLARARIGGSLLVFALGGALPALLPDRVRFVGDFLLRQGTVEEAAKPALLFPQALPLDVLLHYRLPLALDRAGLSSANAAARALGAVEAGLLAVLALAFARALALRGAALVAATAAVTFCGALALLTGYGKAFGELALLACAAAVAAVTVARATDPSAAAPSAPAPAEARRIDRALLALGATLALGLLVHRSAFGFLPVAVTAWWMAVRARGPALLRRPAARIALLVPAVAIAVLAPRIVADVRRWDVVHFAPAEVRAGGGPLRAALAGTRPLDLVNLVLLLAPLALPAVVAALAAGGRRLRRRELAPILALALPFLLVAPFIHPVQGLYRDWDDFAIAGVTLSLFSAWVAGTLLAEPPARRAPAARAPAMAWIAAAAVFGAAVPTVQWLAHQADEARGLERVYAFVREPPRRDPLERAKTWDYIGIVTFRRERWGESADAFARAAETGPSPRILQSWAMAETNRGDLPRAQAIYHRLLATSPEVGLGWLGLAAVSSRLAAAATGDSARAAQVAESRRAAKALLRLEPGNPEAREVLRVLDQIEAPRR